MARDQAHYYRVLGLAPHASRDAVKKAFRGLAQELHPDVTDEPGAVERFREIVEAYEALSHPLRRAGARGTTTRPRPTRPAPARQPARAEVTVPYLDAQRGTRVSAGVAIDRTCPTCRGEGRAPWATPERCPRCDGDGWVRDVSTSGERRWIQVNACPECAGAGVVISQPCVECGGRGALAESRQVDVDVPSGTADGDEISIAGAGHVDGLGAAGDATVVVRVQSPPDALRLRVIALVGVALGLVLLVVMLRPL